MAKVHNNIVFFELDKAIDYYDKIYLFDICDIEDKSYFNSIISVMILLEQKQKILVVSSSDLLEDSRKKNFTLCKIKEDDKKKLMTLYNTYEFSDRFQVVSRDPRYGELFNYVDMGVLTIEQVAEVLLW